MYRLVTIENKSVSDSKSFTNKALDTNPKALSIVPVCINEMQSSLLNPSIIYTFEQNQFWGIW